MTYWRLESTTPTESSWRRETDEEEFYALCIAFALPHGKKILSVCNLPSKRCGMQTMLEKGAVFCRQIGNKRVFNVDLSDKDE
jgi:hypothetical protein